MGKADQARRLFEQDDGAIILALIRGLKLSQVSLVIEVLQSLFTLLQLDRNTLENKVFNLFNQY